MENSNNKHESIVKFLQQLGDDEKIIASVLNNILDNTRFYTLVGDTSVYFSFVIPSKAEDEFKITKFWIDNIEDYIHLYVYAMIFNWYEQWDELSQLKERLYSFSQKYSVKIEKEIEDFKKIDYNKIPLDIIVEIRFIIDSYMWNAYKVMPLYLGSLKKKNLYERYSKLLNNNDAESTDKILDENIDNLKFRFKVTSVENAFKTKYPLPINRDTNLPWNWDVMKRYIEKRCADFCKYGHNTFIGSIILDDFNIRYVVSKKRKKATQMFLKEIVEEIEFANCDESDFIEIQEEDLKETIKTIQSEKFPALNEENMELLAQSVFSILSDTYIHKFTFDEDNYWFNDEHSLPQNVLNVAEKFAQTYMKFYISSSRFLGETINEYISDEERCILDKIVKEDLYQALVETQQNFVRKKLLGEKTNKSDNLNQHDFGSQNSDYEDDPRTDPVTSWIYQP